MRDTFNLEQIALGISVLAFVIFTIDFAFFFMPIQQSIWTAPIHTPDKIHNSFLTIKGTVFWVTEQQESEYDLHQFILIGTAICGALAMLVRVKGGKKTNDFSCYI